MAHSDYEFDVVVVGAGHAGTEAALAAARLGANTALLTTNLDTVGQMSCNPAIGGVGKGQIVREVDALGGAMGLAIDATGIQFRMLNRSKGPAMHGPRAQADKRAYQQEIKRLVESAEYVTLKQESVADLLVEQVGDRPRIVGVSVRGGAQYRALAVVLTTGTFLQAILHYGENQQPGGRAGEGTSHGVSDALARLGLEIRRFKTGTPPRVNGRTLDFADMELQTGDDDPQPFSYLNDRLSVEQLPCWITYTNQAVHLVIRENLHRAPMYSGQIRSTGPRYCPSIEDKVVRFADKERHQIFLEPEGRATHEFYVNGISTSLPRDVQDRILSSIPGMRRAQIMRYGYAVEYDFCPPEQLDQNLECKKVAGLFLAGQINGTTGYEEAAAQGLMAGTNAALAIQGKSPFVLDRDTSYIGVMIDDLVTRGVDEPYRMFTSRAEFRIGLRQDNADRRLVPLGREVGLINAERLNRFNLKAAAIETARQILLQTRIGQDTLELILKRPQATWLDVSHAHPELAAAPPDVAEQVTLDIKYSGYLMRQQQEAARNKRLAEKRLPNSIKYESIAHLRREACEKLSRVRPSNLSQATRISGITPADIALLMAHLEGRSR